METPQIVAEIQTIEGDVVQTQGQGHDRILDHVKSVVVRTTPLALAGTDSTDNTMVMGSTLQRMPSWLLLLHLMIRTGTLIVVQLIM